MAKAGDEGSAAPAEKDGEEQKPESEKDKEGEQEGAGGEAEGAKEGDGADTADAGTLAVVKAEDRAAEPSPGATTAGPAKAKPAKGVIFTLGHPDGWDLKGFFAALKAQKVRSVLDARQPQESELQPEAVRVACSAGGIAYEREPILSHAYLSLRTQADGKSGEVSSPCVLLSGAVSWRLLQARRCISRYFKSKGVEVRHLLWSGEVDSEAAAQCEKEPRRENYKYPKAPPETAGHRPSAPSRPPPVMKPKPKASTTSAEEPAVSGPSSGVFGKTLLQPRAKTSSSAAPQEQPKAQAKAKEASAPKEPAKPKEPAAAAKQAAAPKEAAAAPKGAGPPPKEPARPQPVGLLAKETQGAAKEPTQPAAGGAASGPSPKGSVLQARPKSSLASTAGDSTAQAAKGGMLQARPKGGVAQAAAPQPEQKTTQAVAPKASPAAAPKATPSAATKEEEEAEEAPGKKPRTGPGPAAAAASKPSAETDGLWNLLLSKPSASPGRSSSPESAKAGEGAAGSPGSAAKEEAKDAGPTAVLRSKPKSSSSAAAKAAAAVEPSTPAKAAPAKASPATLQSSAKAAAEQPAPAKPGPTKAAPAASASLQASAKAPGSKASAPREEAAGKAQPPPVLKASAKGSPQPPKGPPPKVAAGFGAKRKGADEDGSASSEGAPAKTSLWSLLDSGKKRRM